MKHFSLDEKNISMEKCNVCPRRCKVNRSCGAVGVCRQNAALRIGRAALHPWEEPCISGKNGSGTVFFCGCNLGCIFCQNEEISHGTAGVEIEPQRLVEIFFELEEQGAHNINLVTPTHYTPVLAGLLKTAKDAGLDIPVVYNTSGYESVETLALLEGLVDIYLPDFKYMDAKKALQYSNAEDYPYVAGKALAEMVRQTGPVEMDADSGLMKKGVLVRHLLLPLGVGNGKAVMDYLWKTYGDKVYVSIMNQYTPPKKELPFSELNRSVTKREYETLVQYAIELGMKNVFIQEGKTAKESFIPSFRGEGCLSSTVAGMLEAVTESAE